jgi:molybdenum cofactor biosynthesis enzyme MoaA
MCYFTDADYVKKLKGQFKDEDLNRVAKAIFNRALKLQVGCGTEPTLFIKLPELIALGKQYKVPYISLTTNANLLTEEKIEALLKAGLNEFTISLHGVTKTSYEHFMQKGDYDKFHAAFNAFKKLKQFYNFKVRINYTFNKDNFHELEHVFEHFDGGSFDILQVRPIQKLGNTEYSNFDISSLKDDYSRIIKVISDSCKTNNIILIAPNSISRLANNNEASFIYDYTFCYISPNSFWKEGFNWKEESFNDFSKKIGWSKLLFSCIFKSKKELKTTSNKLNYEVQFN